MKMKLRQIITLLAALKLTMSVQKECDKTVKPCMCMKTENSEVFLDCQNTNISIQNVCSICGIIRNVHGIDLSNNNLDFLPNNCFVKCDRLEVLSLASNSITVLRNKVFKGLVNLKYLRLDGNKLIKYDGKLDFEAFYHLRTLQTFIISNNSQENDTPWVNMCDICQILPDLRHLDCSENSIHFIPSRCFASCAKLQNLSLASNNLPGLNKTSLDNLTTLKYLNLDNTSLVSNGTLKDAELFQPLSNLEELHVQKNEIVKGDTNCFTYFGNIANSSLNKLRILYLDGLPNGVFGPQFLTAEQLSDINFSGETANCQMFSISKDTFRYTPNVTNLDLSQCNIANITKEAFENLKQLTHLNLSFNMALGFPSLHNISYGLQFTKIEVLDYSKVYKTFGLTTQLNVYDIWFLQNTTLKELYLNSNRMARIETNALIILPRSLEIFAAEDNMLTFGLYALQIGCLVNLKRLELSYQTSTHSTNKFNLEWSIEEKDIDTSGRCTVPKRRREYNCPYLKPGPIDPWKFSVPASLKVVNYRSSSLIYTEPIYTAPFQIRSNVKSLDVSDNILVRATDHFIKLNQLKTINGSRNFISEITGKIFLNIPNVVNVDISYNRIGPKLAEDENGTIFQHAKRLTILDISNNWIGYLPRNIFMYSKALEVLDLSFNKILNLNLDFRGMDNLSRLNLEQNQIKTLPMRLLEQLEQISTRENKNVSINISGNEIDKTCENIEFLSWLLKHPHFFENIDGYLFKDKEGNFMNYSDLFDSFIKFEKNCQTYTAIIVVSLLLILLSVATIVGGLIHRYRWRLRYLYFMAKARFNGYIPVRNQELNVVYKYDVFISYAEEDYRFAAVDMYKQFEEAGFSMCLHQKDFLPGSYIGDNIINAIKQSRITLFVLSPAFLHSKWCIFEFNMARMECIYNRNGENNLFVIMYKPVDLTLISREMQDCLESESYSAFPDDDTEQPAFWRMLIQSMHETRCRVLE